MRSFAILALCMPLVAFAQSAPFCVVSGAGTTCSYFSADACRQSASASNGMCVANANREPAVKDRDYFGDALKAAEAGQAAGRAARESRLRMEAIEAQRDAARRADKPPYTVTYSCPSEDGKAYTTTMAMVGCVVSSVDFN